MSSSGCDSRIMAAVAVDGTPQALGEIDHIRHLSDSLSTSLFLNPEYSDVSLIVEGNSFPGHRIILAARSDYFRALLFGGMKESTQMEVELKDATTIAFKSLLKYVYTGRMSLIDGELKEDAILEVLGLSHQWGFEELESSICEFLQSTLHVTNVCPVLDTALAFGLSSLVTTCAVFCDANAGILLDHPSFLNLSSAGVTTLIQRDSFCCTEEKIFQNVCKWVRQNQDIPNAKEVLASVRLPLMTLNTLLEVVRPTDLVPSDAILDAILAQNKARDAELRYRGYLVPEENVCHVKHGATVLKGEMRQAILDGDVQNYDVERGFSRHIIDEAGDGGGGIVIRLRQQCILNHIRMLLWDRDLRSYSYYIEVSMDMEDWIRVVDHTKYYCRSWNYIYFPQRVVKYIKIVGTHNTVNRMFHVVSVQAFYTNTEFTIDPKFGLLVPKHNVATIDLSACVIEGVSRSRNALINGETTGYDWDSGYTCHQLGSGAIVVQLSQPYVISSMRLLLWDCDDRSYSFYIEVSTNQRKWEMICNKSTEKCKSWQLIRFAPIPIVFIRIVGTDNTANEVFHCVAFEAPAQINDDLKNGKESSPIPPVSDFHSPSSITSTTNATISSTNSANASALKELNNFYFSGTGQRNSITIGGSDQPLAHSSSSNQISESSNRKRSNSLDHRTNSPALNTSTLDPSPASRDQEVEQLLPIGPVVERALVRPVEQLNLNNEENEEGIEQILDI